jgi:hypothetical protein
MEDILPPDITQGAMLRGNEHGWGVSSPPQRNQWRRVTIRNLHRTCTNPPPPDLATERRSYFLAHVTGTVLLTRAS